MSTFVYFLLKLLIIHLHCLEIHKYCLLFDRLSKTTSDKSRDDIPNITELSDPNRPTNIAEKMSDLYENEWTDAFEFFEGQMKEEQIIKTLLDTLMVNRIVTLRTFKVRVPRNVLDRRSNEVIYQVLTISVWKKSEFCLS